MNKWIPVSESLYPKDKKNVQVTYLGYYDKLPRCDAFAYRMDGEWYWSTEDSKVTVEIIAWMENDKPYIPSETNLHKETNDELKASIETPALIELIEEKKKQRLEDENWTKEEEQILAFLVELYFLRTSFIHTFKETKDTLDLVLKLQSEMKEEKELIQ